ncbi:MAG: alpha/beta hydrolase family protein [Gemmatimonadaceae bacterium]
MLLAFVLAAAGAVACARPVRAPEPQRPSPRNQRDSLLAGPPPQSVQQQATLDRFAQQMLFKQLTDLSFFTQLGDEMIVRKIEYVGADGYIIPAYLFAPKDTTTKHPALIVVHGGVHGDFTTVYVPQVRSLVAQGYVLVAPEYRGSTGYGRQHYDAIDYGGKEVEDCIAARDYLAQLVPYADVNRLGMIGWSHGGFITLHSIFRRPELFKVAVAHVPVADLPTRIRTHSESYHQIFAAQKGFGGRLEDNLQKYIDRSPIAHVRKLKIPLLVHAADNDDDVFIIENRNLRDSMIVAGFDKNGLYTYREWHNPPGGHAFGRVDTPEGRESWKETLEFIGKHLKN